jgi:hypothetical protein
MYRAGSLERTADGIAFEIINNLGPAQLARINSISLNAKVYTAGEITFVFDGTALPASKISEDLPASFFLNQVVTILIADPNLPNGDYTIKLDLISREAGQVTLTIQDKLAS